MIAEPDAWDECAACGHDRDDHRSGELDCLALTPDSPGAWVRRACPCEGFEAAA